MKKHALFLVFFLFFRLETKAQQTVGLLQNDSAAYNGYTLWTSVKGAYLIDNCGYLVNEWLSDFEPGLSVYLTENGTLLRCGRVAGAFNGGGTGGVIEEIDWDGTALWQHHLSDTLIHQHHDIEPLPNGNVLAIIWELKTANEATAAGASLNRIYWPTAVLELEKVGSFDANVVWEWHAWDHLVQDKNPDKANFGNISEHPELINLNYRPPTGGGLGPGDWLHVNSVEYNAERDEILLSSRRHNEIFIIDHSTTTAEAASHSGGKRGKGGDLLYRWGNPETYDLGAAIDQKLFGQHDASFIPSGYPNAGAISIFNNGSGRFGLDYTSVEIIEIPLDSFGNYALGNTGIFGPDTALWVYAPLGASSFFTPTQGGAQVLPNGNALICDANKGSFFEVNSTGEMVWRYQNPVGLLGLLSQGANPSQSAASFRITRYAPDFQGFIGKDLTGTVPLEQNPLPYDCILYDGMMTEVSNKYAFDDVQVDYALGSAFVEIKNATEQALHIQVIDLGGKVLLECYSATNELKINITTLRNGLYIVHCSDRKSKRFLAKKIIKI